MIKRERYYDGFGGELHIDEAKHGFIKVTVNGSEIEVPQMKLVDMVESVLQVNGKHVKKYEVRKGI